MELENLEKIRSLNGCAKAFSTYWKEWSEKYVSDPKCDKKHASFTNRDARFTVFRFDVLFSSSIGYYGNSSCSTFSNGIDSKLVQEYFSRALEINKNKLFDDMAKLMQTDAAKLTAEAEKEIASLNSLIAEVKAA